MDGERQQLLSLPKSKEAKMQTITKRLRGVSRYIVGLGLLLGVVVLWTTSNFITASLESGEDGWNKPFLITWMNTSSFTFYLLPTLLRHFFPGKFAKSSSSGDTNLAPYHSLPTDDSPPVSLTAPAYVDERISAPMDKLSTRETAKLATQWCVVWFIANWAVNASLGWTSVASVTILSSTAGFFTLGMGRAFGVETLNQTKILAVVLSFLGVVLVTKSDAAIEPISEPVATPAGIPTLPSHPILGDIAALLSAFFYSVYLILLKVKVGDEERADMQLLLGFAGLFNTICLIPVFPILHWTGVETFELPPTKMAWAICLTNGFITLSSDYLYVLAMLKTTPMLVTIGLSLTIPLALVVSLFLPSTSSGGVTFLSLAGGAFVVIAFAMLAVREFDESKKADNQLSSVQLEQDGDRAVDDSP